LQRRFLIGRAHKGVPRPLARHSYSPSGTIDRPCKQALRLYTGIAPPSPCNWRAVRSSRCRWSPPAAGERPREAFAKRFAPAISAAIRGFHEGSMRTFRSGKRFGAPAVPWSNICSRPSSVKFCLRRASSLRGASSRGQESSGLARLSPSMTEGLLFCACGEGAARRRYRSAPAAFSLSAIRARSGTEEAFILRITWPR